MKIFLVNPPDDLERVIGSGANLITPFEPLGILYIASVLLEDGHEVSAIDAFVEKLSVTDLKQRLLAEHPDIVGFTVFTSNGGIVYELGRWVKKHLPETLVVLGNVHASVFARAYLENGSADAVVHGEGEFVMRDLARTFEKRSRDFSGIPSISFMKDGKFVASTAPGRVEDLSELPFPARDLVPQKLYNIPSVSNLPYKGSDKAIGKHMFTSRGCPNRCTFCTVHHSRRQRASDVMRTVDEMEMLVSRYKASYIFIMDSLFIAKKKRVLEICDEIRRRDLRFRWGCEGHVRYVDPELVKAMEAAGCHDMAFGIESGVQRLLDTVKKGINPEMVRQAAKVVKKNSGIKLSGLFILGLPGETRRDSLETIRFATSLPLDMAQFSVLVPYPGSEIFYDLAERGEIDTGVRPDGSFDTDVWLRYSSYVSYTKNEPIWVTEGLTADELKALQKKAVRSFYFRPRQFVAQVRRLKLSSLPTMVKTAFDTFF